MSSALYRKYRPQSFSQMIGQNHIKITLQHELAKGDIGHAYLFCGPRGLGKTTSARLFAKSVNCEKRQPGESEPCNDCQSCLDIIAGRSVDIIEIDAASNTGVDNVRENIIENSRFNPIRSKYKVFIIDEVHMLSTPAFNALLKIMEEPPAHVIFILCTTETHKVPLTIISRCQRFDFKKVTGEEMLKRLQLVVLGEEKKVEDEVLKRIIVNSEGCVRDAESLLAKVLSLGDDITADQAEIVLPRSDFESVSAFVGYLAENNSAAAIELINRLMDDGVDLVIFTDSLLEFLRQMLLVKTSGRLEIYGIELSNDLSKGIVDLAEKFNWAEIVDMLEVISTKSKEIRQSAIAQLPLEIAIVRITQKVSCQKPDTISFVTASVAGKIPVKPAVQAPELAKTAPKEDMAILPGSEAKNFISKNSQVPIEQKPNINDQEPPLNNEPQTPAQPSNFTLGDVITKWPNVVQKLLLPNFTLSSLLKMSQPIKVDNGYIHIAVSSEFFRGRLESANNRTVIEGAIESEIGQKILIKGVVTADVQPVEMVLDYADPEAEAMPDSSIPAITMVKLDPVEEAMNMF